jgi:hypothetical protein
VMLSIESKVQDDDSPHQISELYLVIFSVQRIDRNSNYSFA